MPKALHESRRQVCEHRALPLLLHRWVCWDLLIGALSPDRPGVLAMEALHRQVLPFLLRRMKEDVLQDLPPKIIQDYYCTLSPLQVTTAPGCSGMSCLFCRSPPVTHIIEMRVLAPDSVSVQLSGRQIVSLAECEYFPQETRNLAQA